MASISFFPSRSDRVRVAALCVALLVSAGAHANPANCDNDMTEDQRFQASLCSAHAGCRFVFGIADTCIKAKSFLSRLGLGGRGSATEVTDSRVSNALVESGVPQSGISSCLFDFDRTKCGEYLSGGPKQPGAKEKADEIVERLKGKVYDTTVWDAGLGLAKEGLLMCDAATNEANMRDAVRAKERCALADGNINACLSTKQGHEELRRNLQSLIDGGGLGADAAGYRSLASTPYPACPTTLPSSGKTPKVALADYLKFWDTPEEPKSKKTEPAGGTDGIAGLLEKGVSQVEKGISQVSDWFSKAFSSEQKPTSKEEESKREAGAWVDKNLADTQARADREQEEKNRKAQEASARLERAREAERIANQTPAERITDSFDQRIAAAREQCAANDSSCNTGCMAVAAVGVFSIFMARGSSASGAAGEQVQQCSNRCDQAKSSCEQEVSALEQEKSRAISNATRGPSVASANTAATGAGAGGRGASAGGRSCREILESLVGPVNDGNPMNAAGSNLRYPLGQIYSDQVWAAQIYVRVANTHPACANDQSSKEAVAASLRSTQGYCRQTESLRSGGPFNCDTGQSYGGTAARTEAAIRQLFQETSVAGGGGAPARPPDGTCKAAVAQQEADFTVINQRGKSTGAANSTVPSMQVGLYMMSERLKLLDRLCRGQPEYGGYASMKQSQDSTMRACRQIATNSADCAPRVAW